MARCRCGSGRTYKRCCQPWHGGRPAPTAEALMRSRYTAYALVLVDYILDTTHPRSPHWRDDRDAWRADVARFCTSTRFVGLSVREAGPHDGDRAHVRFHAHLEQAGRDASFEEDSVFERVDGRWLYVAASATRTAG